MVTGVSRGMGVLDEGGDRRREGAVLVVNLGRPVVTNGDFATRLFPNYFGQDLLFVAAQSGSRNGLCFAQYFYLFRQ